SQLFIFRVKVRRNAYAGAGPVINDELAANQFFGKGGGIVIPNCDCAAAPRRIFGAGNPKAGFLCEGDQKLSLPNALLANRVAPDFVDDFVAPTGSIQGRNCRRAVQESG